MRACTVIFLKFPGPGPGVGLVVPVVSGFWTKGICAFDLKCAYSGFQVLPGDTLSDDIRLGQRECYST
jgi:hypothetical protein